MDLNKKHYEVLLKMSYLANRIVSDSDIISEAEMQEFEKMQDFLCKNAKKNWFKDLLDQSSEDVSQKIDKNCQDLIEEYNDFNFWEELKTRLSERDFDKDHKKNGSKPINVKEKIQKTMDFEEIWDEEFEKFGINRLWIVK